MIPTTVSTSESGRFSIAFRQRELHSVSSTPRHIGGTGGVGIGRKASAMPLPSNPLPHPNPLPSVVPSGRRKTTSTEPLLTVQLGTSHLIQYASTELPRPAEIACAIA
jgi:hypothetical protein